MLGIKKRRNGNTKSIYTVLVSETHNEKEDWKPLKFYQNRNKNVSKTYNNVNK